MGAPVSEVKAAEGSAESLLDTFKSIDAAERRRHASVLNYWLSIRGDKDVAPIRDLDPLEISDAGPNSLLLELIGGGEDAEIKHVGEALKPYAAVEHLSAAQRPSLLTSIAGKLAIVAISRNFLAFEDQVPAGNGTQSAWITLLPFSSTGVWVEYVYAFVSIESDVEATEPAEDPVIDEAIEEPVVDDAVEEPVVEDEPVEEIAELEVDEPEVIEPAAEMVEPAEAELRSEPELESEAVLEEEVPVEEKRPGFSKIFEALTGFHGTSIKVEPTLPPIEFEDSHEAEPDAAVETDPAVAEHVEPVADEPETTQAEDEQAVDAIDEEPLELVAEASVYVVAEAPAQPEIHAAEGPLQNKLEEVRGKADEARQAKLRSNLALYAGLSAAYDFALDAEDSPEEYLRLVEAQGLKIQLRSPMTPVVKLAFDGLCDESTIGQLEAVLAWALKQDLPRGSLAGRIEEAGGIGPILAQAA
jgi:hypothetical protein